MSEIKEGNAAPNFKGVDQNGKIVELANYANKKLILYFYPKDNTPGCTKEACNLRDNYDTLKDNDFEVVGDFLSFDPYGLMVRRNDSAYELVGKAALADVFRSGEIDAIYSKWFDPLGVPATPLLKASFTLNALPE